MSGDKEITAEVADEQHKTIDHDLTPIITTGTRSGPDKIVDYALK